MKGNIWTNFKENIMQIQENITSLVNFREKGLETRKNFWGNILSTFILNFTYSYNSVGLASH